MKISDAETSIVNGVHTVLREIRLIMNGTPPVLNDADVLKKLFDRDSVGSSGHRWSFFDDIMLKYMEGTGQISEDDSKQGDRLACALVVICLSEFDDFVRFLFDIFVTCSKEQMTLQDYATVLRTILPSHVEDCTLDEHVNSFSLHVLSHPLRVVEAGQERDADASTSFPKSIAVQYHIKTHKQLLWPLKVAQEQVKMKFLGVNFWTGLHQEISSSAEVSTHYLPSQAEDFGSFVDTILFLFSMHLTMSKLPNPAPRHSSPISRSVSMSPDFTSTSTSTSSSGSNTVQEIVEAGGIFTYRHPLSVGVGRRKYASAQNAVHLHSPIDHLLRGDSIASEGRRFPLIKGQHGSFHGGDMRNELTQVAKSMAGLNILIIEDSKLQRKMMHHKLAKAGSFIHEDKHQEGGHSSSPVIGFDSSGNPVPAPPPPPHAPMSSSPVTAAVTAAADADEAWSVSDTSNGEEAIQMIIDTKTSFDVIFVDENLTHSGGNMLGHEFVSILRGHSSVLPTTVIIGCSANAEVYVSDFLMSGADAVWQKPMPPAEVIHSEICKYIVTRGKYSRLP